MEDTPGTPGNSRYQLRTRTPSTNTPSTPLGRSDSTGTPKKLRGRLAKMKLPSTPNTPQTCEASTAKTCETPSNNTPNTPLSENIGTPRKTRGRPPKMKQPATPTTPQTRVFNTPMAFKPHLVDNKPVPSPSRPEIWKKELGLSEETCGSDKENSSEEEDETKGCMSAVEHRALQKVLADKDAKHDEVLLQLKSYRDKMRQYRSKLDREENTKRQQLKILRKTHETQLAEKDQLINNLQSLVEEHEERLQELDNSTAVSPKKTKFSCREPEVSSSGKLIDEIRRLQEEKVALSSQLSECQVDLMNIKEESSQQIAYLQRLVPQSEAGSQSSTETPRNHSNTETVLSMPCSTDTEKQVEVLQSENEKLFMDLTEAKNAHTKAVTVSKLAAHRQQQLEEELRRVKAELEGKAKLCALLDQEKLESQIKTQQVQAEMYALLAKQQEVDSAATVKKSVCDAQRQLYEKSQALNEQLQQSFNDTMKALTEAQTQNALLQQSCDQKDTLRSEAGERTGQLEQSLEEKTKAFNEAQDQITHLEKLVNDLQSEKEASEELTRTERENLLSQHQDELQRLRTDLTQDRDKAVSQIKAEIAEEKASHEKHILEVTAQLELQRQETVREVTQKLQTEKDEELLGLGQHLNTQYEQQLLQVREEFTVEKAEALEKQRADLSSQYGALQQNYEELVSRLSSLNPVLSNFVESYILLQKEVKGFPKLINKIVGRTKREVLAAISGISEMNQDLVRKYHQEMKLRKKYHNELVELKGNIRVFCRVRPVIPLDGTGKQAENVVQLDADDDGLLSVNSKQGRLQTFDMDRVFGETSSQAEVFNEVKALVTSCVDGYNVCIFAYGQTGSGKTYTMEGTPSDPGLNQRALKELFAETESRGKDWSYTITVSVIEIYNEMIRDLLGDDTSFKMEVKMNPDGGFYIPGLSYVTVQSVKDVNECFGVGQKNRATAATNLNEHSSRSHALLCVTVTGVNISTNVRTTGKLNLVDLAGSERVSKSKADGARLKEAQNINKSLSCLGDVIHALRSKQSYIPYRNSKLTYMLQDSLGGDSKTLMITQVSPIRSNEGETICSLNFAQRVRNVELGAATRRMENGDLLESEPSSPARSTPQRSALQQPRMGTPTSLLQTPKLGTPSSILQTPKLGTPSSILQPKLATPSSNSKLTPGRQPRRK